VGGGAAGLMAACTAAELGVRAVLVERKHRPGRKILLCGNNRCNLTSDLSVEVMLSSYGPPVDTFLEPALRAFSSRGLREWLSRNGLQTVAKSNKRVYPKSEKADDVLHFFTDCLRDRSFPLLTNCAVTGLEAVVDGFKVISEKLILEGRSVLVATGGVSYPKTGSVGDGQKMASKLGLKVRPYRPGLAGIVPEEKWLCRKDGASIQNCTITLSFRGKELGVTRGDIITERWGLSGRAIIDATRILARHAAGNCDWTVDLSPGMHVEALAKRLMKLGVSQSLRKVLGLEMMSPSLASVFAREVLSLDPEKRVGPSDKDAALKSAALLKQWPLRVNKIRPLKEAMVTVGGVDLGEIDSHTMESKRHKGLYFAGEIMDVDGPSGGYNLQAAFSTARLAVQSMARSLSDC